MRIIPGSIPLRAKVSKNFLSLLQLLSGVAALAFVGWHLTRIDTSLFSLQTIGPYGTALLLLCLALMMANWALEARKWQLLAGLLEDISYFKALKGVLVGVSVGLITPRRSGEFAGRIMVLAPANQLNGMLLNMAASVSQLFVTLFMGSLGMAIFLFVLKGQWHDTPNGFSQSSLFFLIPGFLFSGLILLFAFGLPGMRFRFSPHHFIARACNQCLDAFALLSPLQVSTLLFLSLIRYGVFLLQFFLLLQILGLSLPFSVFFTLTAMKYLVLTLFPLSAIWELGIRGSVAIFVFGMYLPAQEGWTLQILAATASLWVINLALPALAGGVSALSHSFQNKSSA